MICLLLLALAFSLSQHAESHPANNTNPDYQRQYLLRQNGQTIGTIRVRREHETAANERRLVSIESKNYFKRNGKPFETGWQSRFIQPVSYAEPIAFDYVSTAGESQIVSLSGAIDRQKQRLEILDDHQQPIQHLALNASLPFVLPESGEQEALFKAHYGDQPGETFAFQTLELGTAPRLVSTKVTVLTPSTTNPHTRRFQLASLSTEGSSDEASPHIIEWRNTKGELLKAKLTPQNPTGTTGTELLYAMQALSPLAPSAREKTSLDVIRDTHLASAYIPNPRNLNKAIYRISLGPSSARQESPTGFLQNIPQDQRQKIIRQAENTVTLSVSANAETKAQGEALDLSDPQQAKTLSDWGYLYGNGLIDATHPEVQKAASAILEGHINPNDEVQPYFAGQILRRWVYQNIENKSYDIGFASASQTLQNKSGDCSEHAVLLSALLRALKIPSRVAVGLLYLPDDSNSLPETASKLKSDVRIGHWVFHLWSEALTGWDENGNPVWASLDASQKNDVMDAAHIKLGDSSLNSVENLETMVQLAGQAQKHFRLEVLSAYSSIESVVNLNKMGSVTLPRFSFDSAVASGNPSPEPEIDNAFNNDMPLSAQAIPPLSIDLNDPETLFGTSAKEKRYRIKALPSTLSRSTAEGSFQYGLMKLESSTLEKNRYDEALKAFEDALRLQADNPVALLLSARRLFSLEMYQQARQAFQQAASGPQAIPQASAWLAYIPTNLSASQQAQYHQALFLKRQEQYPEAESALKAFLKQKPDLAQAYAHLAQVRKAQGASELEVVGLYRKYAALLPNDPRAAMALGEIALEGKHFLDAKGYWQEASLKARKDPIVWHALLPECEAKLTIASALDTLRLNRKNASAWVKLGEGYQKIASFKEAVKAYQQALIYQPSHATAHARLMDLALAKGDWTRAGYDVYRLSAHSHPEALRAIGYYWMRQRQYDKAIAFLKRASAQQTIDKSEALKTLSEAYVRRYDLYRRPADWQNALRTLQSGIQNASSKKDANTLKQAYIETVLSPPMPIAKPGQKNPAAITLSTIDYQTALGYARALTAEDWAYLDAKSRVFEGRLLTLLHRYDEAEKSLKTVLDINPYDADALAAMGYLSQVEESPQQAIGYYQKALKLEPRQFMASQGLYTLMLEEKLPTNDFKGDWLLSEDEKDYLRMWSGAKIAWGKRQIALSDKLSPLLSDWGNLTLKADTHRQTMLQTLSLETQWLQSVYQELKSIPVPARFSQFQFLSLAVLYSDLQWIEAQKAFLPQFTDVSSEAKRALMSDQFKKAINNMNTTRDNLSGYIRQQLPVDSVSWEQVVFAASGLGPEGFYQLQAEVKSSLDQISQRVASQLNPPTPAVSPQKNNPSAIIDPSKLPSIVPKTMPALSR
ncbi:MAG: tetratricopeptide repeat protein [Vampirovibrionales bacterium]|nr:tetratricopeptide repeat protein [Vampirovibrionales bacterium]